MSNRPMIYLLSGPLGVGKSTASKELFRLLERGVLIEGDHFLHLPMTEPKPAWEERLELAWRNILAVTRNCVGSGFHVVIDFVVEDEMEWIRREFAELGAAFTYVVLVAEETTLNERLTQRGDVQALERSLFLLEKLKAEPWNGGHVLSTDQLTPLEVAAEAVHNPRFRMTLHN